MRTLIAGVGNIFANDDAFGCEVVHQMTVRGVPDSVTAADFGARSYDLAFALTDGFEAVILVGAVGRGGAPGTLYLIEPDIQVLSDPQYRAADAHAMDPVAVIQMARSMGKVCSKLFLVGCETGACENEDGQMGLSPMVRAALPEAIAMIDSLISDLSGRNKQEQKITEFAPA
jgi:hydrogenase maturation protease